MIVETQTEEEVGKKEGFFGFLTSRKEGSAGKFKGLEGNGGINGGQLKIREIVKSLSYKNAREKTGFLKIESGNGKKLMCGQLVKNKNSNFLLRKVDSRSSSIVIFNQIHQTKLGAFFNENLKLKTGFRILKT